MLLIEIPHSVALVRLADRGGLEGVDEVGYRHGFGAVWAESAEADAGAGLVAVVAPLLAVVAGFAGWAGVDRDVAASDRLWDNGFGDCFRGGVAAGPGGLAAGVGAVALATDPGEGGPADRAEQRAGVRPRV